MKLKMQSFSCVNHFEKQCDIYKKSEVKAIVKV